jgi:integrase
MIILDNNNVKISMTYYPCEYSMGEKKREQVNVFNLLQKYKQYLESQYRKERTRRQYYRIAKDFLETTEVISQDSVEQYMGMLNKAGYKHNTIASHTICLNLFLKWSGHESFCLPYKKFKEIQRNTLNTDEIIQLLDAARTYEELLVLLFIVDLDARTSEICEARWSQVGREKYFFKESKTGDNSGFMTDRFKTVLYKYRELERPVPRKGFEDFIFIHTYGRYKGFPFKSHGAKIRKMVEQMGDRIDVSHLLPYDLRSSVITEEFNHYLNPKLVQVKARHKQFTTTNRYNKAGERELREYARNGTVFDEAEISKDSKGLFKRKSGNKHSLLKRFDRMVETEISIGVDGEGVDSGFSWSTVHVDEDEEDDVFWFGDYNNNINKNHNVYNRIKPFCIVNKVEVLL